MRKSSGRSTTSVAPVSDEVAGDPRHGRAPHHPVAARARDRRAADLRALVRDERTEQRLVVGRVLDRGRPHLPHAEVLRDRHERVQPLLHLPDVGPVDRAGGAGRLVRVRHPPEDPALLGAPVDPGAHVEDHRAEPLGREVGMRLRHDDLMPGVPDPRAPARELRDGLHPRSGGQDHAAGRDRAGARLDAGHDPRATSAGLRAEPEELGALAELHAGLAHRVQVGLDVRRRIEPPVGRDVRPAAVAALGEGRTQPAGLVRVDPPHVEPVLLLHRDPVGGRLLVGARRGEDHVSLALEPRVEPVGLALPSVEVDAPRPEPDRVGRAALGPDHARRAARRALARDVAVDHEHAPGAGLLREHRRPAADRARADHHQVGRLPFRHGSNSSSRRGEV